MIQIDLEVLYAMARLQMHASHEAIRRIYRMVPPLGSMDEILDVLERDEGGSLRPGTPRDGECPVCGAHLTTYRGHRLLCPRKSECAGCGALLDEECVCPEASDDSHLLQGLDVDELRTPPTAEERKRLVAVCRRACAQAKELDA